SLRRETWRRRASCDRDCHPLCRDRPEVAEEYGLDRLDHRQSPHLSYPIAPSWDQTSIVPNRSWPRASLTALEDSWHPQSNDDLWPTVPAVHNPRTDLPSSVANGLPLRIPDGPCLIWKHIDPVPLDHPSRTSP